MFDRRTFLAALALSSLGLPRLVREVGANTGEPVDPAQPPQNPQQTKTTILICGIGDLQRTSDAEAIVLSRGNNDAEREKIIAQVVKEKPDLLLLMGDQVADAADVTEWNFYDRVTKPIRDANIKTLAVRGNHDYNIRDKRMCDRECQSRWPETKERPHFHTLGPLAFIGVDSNLDMLTPQEIRAQQKRFVDGLKRYDEDQAIRGIIVFAHHPPYTNSYLGPNQDMITQFAEPFMAAKKTKIFLCGHVHSYERFEHNKGEKQFVTSGGGGGPRRTIDVSNARPFKNDSKILRLGELRPFNFLRLTVDDKEILGEAMMVQKKGFVVGDKFRIKLDVEQTVVAAPQ
jgi:Icc-related predicted phosphoesterase